MSRKYVCFTIERSRYGIPVDQVTQIIRYEQVTAVPTAPPFVEGVLNVRSEVIPVISLRKRFGLPPLEGQRKRRIIVIVAEGRTYGLLVDEVREIMEIADDAIHAEAVTISGVKAEYLVGVAHTAKEPLILMDVTRLLSFSADGAGIKG